MSSPPKYALRARVGAACLAVTLVAGGTAVVAPAAWAEVEDSGPATSLTDSDESETDRPDETPGDPGTPGEEAPEAPRPSESPTPEPTAPSPAPSDPPSPAPTSSPEPTASPEPTSSPEPEPAPPLEEEPPAPSQDPVETPRVETGPRVPSSAAARFGALLRLPTAAASPALTPADEVHLDGGPDVGGSAELNASVSPEAATGQTDAVQVGALNDGAGAALAHPVVWTPWAGALGAAAAAVVVLLLRGGRQIGR
ncbi:hypothetical protein [Microbacterium oleivorans]|uniref:Uncharacterized protein n=1 Tax=Microbacterium oleivorans TaxID=273677 RepID=A0A7D5JET2_9MICO|nr:hypothetical protein [Microbacterium oleivorans]QLD13120.1 hypothetical protein HW566_15880 [Microbacterium oleivorans]